MPYQKSKKSKNSKNSKSGGRRRKHTMKKYRRGRKVMRGGDYTASQIMEGFDKLTGSQKAEFLNNMGPSYIDRDILETGIGFSVPDAQKAINLLKGYNVLT